MVLAHHNRVVSWSQACSNRAPTELQPIRISLHVVSHKCSGRVARAPVRAAAYVASRVAYVQPYGARTVMLDQEEDSGADL